jgi:uncharacterized protein YcaQ
MQGDLMVVGREGFQKIYDLTERVLPAGIDTSTPTTYELADHLVDNSVRSHGFATAKAMTYQRPGSPLRQAVKEVLKTRCDEGRLVSFALDNGERVYGDPEFTDCRAPSAPGKARILSPFDNAVIQRERGQALFDFDYQMECYVTEEKRRFGYFCLPILYRDRLIGRMDCKAHRKDGRLDIKALHLEDSGFATRFSSEEADKLADAIVEFGLFNQCAEVNLLGVFPKHCYKSLNDALTENTQNTQLEEPS